MARVSEQTDYWEVLNVMEIPSETLRGMRISITGHLSKTRDEVVKIIEDAGGVFDKAPIYGTRYLLTNGDWSEGSTVQAGASRKLLKAQELGVRVIGEKAFIDLICDRVKKLEQERNA